MKPNGRSEPARAQPHRVAIVGAGFGGLFGAKALRRDDVEVTVVDRTNHHLFQPLLYQLATGILAQGDIAPPIRDILRRRDNVNVLLGDVKAIDLDARRLTVDTLGLPSELPYDSLILAAGAEQSYFGHPEFARHAPGMKRSTTRSSCAVASLAPSRWPSANPIPSGGGSG
jgi:NADH:ubiquinone reductase (H+-translocating)